jgi:hypothetical protein
MTFKELFHGREEALYVELASPFTAREAEVLSVLSVGIRRTKPPSHHR